MTIAVPVKDRRDQMLRCLRALLAQDHPSYEILVVDNGSVDGTPEAVAQAAARQDRVSVRVEVVHGSVGRARNRAAELARGELLAFTDSDCLPEPGWLTAAAAALRADPGLGAVQGKTLPEEEVVHGWPATIRVEEFTGLYESCNLVFRTRAFRASDGFDELPGRTGWEDTAAGFALKRAGWGVGWAPDAVVRHDVTYPGFWWHVRHTQRHRRLAEVLERYPEMRRETLFARVFMRPRNAKFAGFAAGAVAIAARRPVLGALLATPYAWFLLTEGRGGPVDEPLDLKRYSQAVVYDAAITVGLLRGGLRNGRIVI